MNVHALPRIAEQAVATRPTRPATALVHDSPDARAVLFRIDPGQAVPAHSNASTVLLMVVSGRGIVAGATGERPVSAGELVAYEPGEPHGMRADGDAPLVIVAVIAPRPGG